MEDGIMKEKKVNLKAEGKALRQQFTAELDACELPKRNWGYDENRELNRRLRHHDLISTIIEEMAMLLKPYNEVVASYSSRSIYVYGHAAQNGVRPGKIRNCFTLWKHNWDNTVRFYSTNRNINGNNVVELLDCMDRLIGKQLAILIQDDADLYKFYQAYTEWLAPYSKRLNSWRSEFMTLLLNWVKSLILSTPEEEPCTKAVQYNLMGLFHKLKEEIEEYRLADSGEKIVWLSYGVRIRADKELWVLQMDTETFNCLEVQIRYNDSGKQAIERKLTDNQIIQILIQLIEMLGYSENPYCILFRFALCKYMKEYVLFLEGELNDDEVIELLKQ